MEIDKLREEISELAEQKKQIDDKLSSKLCDLSNELKVGMECKCEGDTETVEFVHNGSHFDEITTYCLNCGGMKADVNRAW